MKRLLWLLITVPAFSQSPVIGGSVQYVTTAPSGACQASPPIQVVKSTGAIYTCNNGTWVNTSGGSGGSGIVNAGTTGQIAYYPSSAAAVSGATLPSLGIAPGAINVLNYGAISDASTDNASAFTAAFVVSNAITSGIPVVYFPCKYGSQCQYNYSGSGVSSINPLIPTTILCDPGVTLRYTGSAHALDIGPVGLTINTYQHSVYRVSGCRFTDSGSETYGIYVNVYIPWLEIDHNIWYDSPASGAGAAWPLYLAGANWDSNVHDNHWMVDNNTTINEGLYANPFDLNSQVRFHDNDLFCQNGVSPCTVSGSGPTVSGWGSLFSGNNIAFLQPDIRILPLASQVKITSNYFELTPGSSFPAIAFGTSGDAVGTYIDGLIIANNSWDNHQGTTSFIAPATANDLLTNTLLDGLTGINVNNTSTVPVVKLNNLAGQTGNQAHHLTGMTSTTPPGVTNLYVHTMGSLIPPWLYLDHGAYSDGFSGSGALPAPWINISGSGFGGSLTIASNVLSCAGTSCDSFYGLDVSNNQTVSVVISTVPTGTDQAYVLTRAPAQAAAPPSLSDYECTYVNGTGIQLYEVNAGSFTQLGSTYSAVTPSAGDQLILESIGNVHTCYLQHTGTGAIKAVGPILNTVHPVGFVGIGLFGTTGRLGSFSVKSFPDN